MRLREDVAAAVIEYAPRRPLPPAFPLRVLRPRPLPRPCTDERLHYFKIIMKMIPEIYLHDDDCCG